jgi:hypothetical protein
MTHEETTNILQNIANDVRYMHDKLEEGDCDTGDLLSFVDRLLRMVKDVPVQEEEEDEDED